MSTDEQLKICPQCKHTGEFSKSSWTPNGMQSICKKCEKENHAKKYASQIEFTGEIPKEKECTRCDTVKPSSDFSRHSKSKDGLQRWCKVCKVEHQAKKYAEPGGLDYHNKYYRAHQEIMKPRMAAERRAEPWRKIVLGARHRSNKFNIPYDIDVEWARKTYRGICEVSGLRFEVKEGSGGHWPLSPSIDRIKPELGYTKENCRWVCMGINSMKGTGDDALMMRIVFATAAAYSAEQFMKQSEVAGGNAS